MNYMKMVEAFALIGIFLWMSAWFFGVDAGYSRMTFLMACAIYAKISNTQPQGGKD